MAVYTKVSRPMLEEFLSSYESIGRLDSYSEISAGIENSNYFVHTIQQGKTVQGASDLGTEEQSRMCKYVLTIFENLSSHELPFFSSFTQYLSKQNLPVPAPIVANNGDSELMLCGKPAVLVPCMPGESTVTPSLRQSKEAAIFLATMHKVQSACQLNRQLVRDLDWVNTQMSLLQRNGLGTGDQDLLRYSLERYREYSVNLKNCPQGIVHGDLFRDNVLFSGDQVSGVIDFYHACNATLIFDLAVLVNDWAWNDASNQYDAPLVDAILQAYQQHREWVSEEHRAWANALELAALRFWISRLVSLHVPGYQDGAIVGAPIKDPGIMKAKLLAAQALAK